MGDGGWEKESSRETCRHAHEVAPPPTDYGREVRSALGAEGTYHVSSSDMVGISSFRADASQPISGLSRLGKSLPSRQICLQKLHVIHGETRPPNLLKSRVRFLRSFDNLFRFCQPS